MSTGAIVAISVVGVAVVGGVVFLVVRKKAAPAKQPTSTTDKVVSSISSLIPIGVEIAKLWNKD